MEAAGCALAVVVADRDRPQRAAAASREASPRCRARARRPCPAAGRSATRPEGSCEAGSGWLAPVPSAREGGRRSSQPVCRHQGAPALVSGVIPIEERFPRPSVMGVVNVTPDSFSDGGVTSRPRRRGAGGAPHGRGGSGDRRRRRRVDATRLRRRLGRGGAAARRSGSRSARRRAPALDRHVEGGRRPCRARAGRDPRQRRDRAARRSRARGSRRRAAMRISA